MIYPLTGIVIGAVLGGIGARRNGGNGRDIAQWAAVGGMICGLIGLFILVFIARSVAAGG